MAEINVKQALKRDFIWLVGFSALFYAAFLVAADGFGYDSHAYWLAIRGDMYSEAPKSPDAYLYSPAFVHALWPILSLPWPVFCGLWMIMAGVTLAYLLMPLGWKFAVPLWLACTPEIVTGNVFWVFAVVVAFGLRHPASWTFVFLTKITPAIGPVWFLARREWRNLFVSGTVTVVVIALSVAIDPDSWRAWIEFLQSHLALSTSWKMGLAIPQVIRIPMAVLMVAWGALRTKYWTIPAAMALATPVFGPAALVVFAGLPRLKQGQEPRAAREGTHS